MDANELAARNGIGERIKAERLRLGLSPEDFAVKVEVSRATVFNHESGVRMPDALALQRMAAAGVDVLLVLTGKRIAVSQLTCEQEQLLQRHADMPQRLRQVVEDVAAVSWLAFDNRRTYDYTGELSTSHSASSGGTYRVHEPAPGKLKRNT